MNKIFENIILKSTGAKDFFLVEEIQDLWSGYGKIIRFGLSGSERESVVVKHVRLPGEKKRQAKGSGLSHQRKVKSYRVEMAWYKEYAPRCDDTCRIPAFLGGQWQGDEFLMVFEDLDAAGYPRRKRSVSWNEAKACFSWLAHFHGEFLGVNPNNLWKLGTYWHLDTRPDELKALDDADLKKAAGKIDLLLKQARFKTLVHGDAKLANFCFFDNGDQVAAVDFQYVGGGCGMKDLAYLAQSCFHEEECESLEPDILDCYFNELKRALESRERQIDFMDIEDEWRRLYPVAWADFHRFFKGWSPGYWSESSYSERISRKVIESL